MSSLWDLVRVTAAEFSCLRPASDPADTAAAAAVAAMGLARDLLGGHAAILPPPARLLFCQQHLSGPITGLDQVPIGMAGASLD